MNHFLKIEVSENTIKNLKLIQSVANGPISIEEIAAEYVKQKTYMEAAKASMIKHAIEKMRGKNEHKRS